LQYAIHDFSPLFLSFPAKEKNYCLASQLIPGKNSGWWLFALVFIAMTYDQIRVRRWFDSDRVFQKSIGYQRFAIIVWLEIGKCQKKNWMAEWCVEK